MSLFFLNFNLVGIVLCPLFTLLISSYIFTYSSLCFYELQNEKGKSWQRSQSSGSFMSLDVMSSLVACVPVNEVVMSGVLLMNIMSFITFILELIVRVSVKLALFLCLWLIDD